jgi:hypothetical protein
MSVPNYNYSLRDDPEEPRSHLHRGGSLKSRNLIENNRMFQEQFTTPCKVSTCTKGLYENDNGKLVNLQNTDHEVIPTAGWGGGGGWADTGDCCYRLVYWTESQFYYYYYYYYTKTENIKLFE